MSVPPGPQGPLGAEPAPLIVLPPVVRAGAGSTSAVPATVTNLASEPRELLVLAVGVDQAWLRGPVRTRVLAPGESEHVSLPLAPTAGSLPAEYPLAVTVQAVVPATGRASSAPTGLGETSVIVNPRAQLTFDVSPERARLVRSRKIRATLRNAGTVPTTVELQGTATQGLLVQLRKREVTVPPGGETVVRGRLVATRPRRIGSPLNHSWSINATSSEIVRQVRGTAQQRALLGAGFTKAIAVVAVVAVWAAAVLVLVQEVPKRIKESDEASQSADGGSGDGGGADGAGGKGGGAGGAPGGKIKITQAKAGKAPSGLQVAGTVDTPDPSGVTVSIQAISLASQEAEQADNVDEVRTAAYEPGSGKISPSSFVLRLPQRAPEGNKKADKLHSCSDLGECTATTTEDGAWSIADVKPSGYYLVTFRKPGLVTQSHVVDAANFDPTEPLEVVMEPGDGELTGTVRDGAGLLGGATVTVSDGTSTITTSTASSGPQKGRWKVSGLQTPATYSVQVSSFGLGTESRLADLQEDQDQVLDVSMKPGAALVSGVVKGRDATNRLRKLGGVTVTVTDSEGTVRTATTATDENQLGFYSLSGVPSPGEYVVALSATGYQTQTKKLTIGDDDGAARVDASLELASGGVGGTVTDAAGSAPIDDAGLTLSDGVNTYKTTPRTDRGHEGEFSFAGVVPGLYRLTTERYLYRSSVITLEVPAGEPKRADPVLTKLEGEAIPATSTIQGGAVTAGTSDDLACDDDDSLGDDCIVAKVYRQKGGEPGDTDTPESPNGSLVQVGNASQFGPGGEYTLPGERTSSSETSPTGLKPGLYVVEVSAAHYETARMTITVGQGDKIVADDIALEKAPKITGLVSSVVDAPVADKPTCVWAVSASVNPASLPSCQEVTAPKPAPADKPWVGECRTAVKSYDDDNLPNDRVCASVTTSGQYTIEVPKRGEYKLVVQTTDPEYIPPPVASLTVPAGSEVTRNVELTRYGRLVLDARTPQGDGALGPQSNPVVTMTPVLAAGSELTPSQVAPIIVVSGNVVTAKRLYPGVTYKVNVQAPDDGNPATLERRAREFDARVDYNQVASRIVVLRPTVASFYFRATTSYLGTTQTIAGAKVTATGPTEYDGVDLVPGEVLAETNTKGCVALVRDTAATPANSTDCPASSYTGTANANSLVAQDFMFDKFTRFKVVAPGYKTLDYSDKAFTPGTSLNSLPLEPEDVAFTGTVRTSPASQSTSGARFRVESNGTVVPSVTVGVDSSGNLVWNDSRLGQSQRIVPGVYTVTASLDGYETDSATIRCTVDLSPQKNKVCVFNGVGDDLDGNGTPGQDADDLTLVKYGSLTVRATDQSGAPVNNALVTLIDTANGDRVIAQQQSANTNNVVTFTNLEPSATGLKVRVQAPSYETEVHPNPGALRCGGVARTSISIPAGGDLDCTTPLKRLGTFTGTVTGDLGSTGFTRELAGATVTATPCTTVKYTGANETGTAYCTAVNTSRRLTTTAGADGTYELTGNAQIAGITEEPWLVTVAQPGWRQPALPAAVTDVSALRGVLKDVENGGDIPLDLRMDVVPVTYTVTLNDQAGLKVNKATIKLMQGSTVVDTKSGATTPVTDGKYVFTNVIPGQYTLEVSGGFLITSTVPIEAVVGVSNQAFTVYGSKAINTLKGSVKGTDVADGLDGAKVEVIACSPTCSGPAVDGTNDVKMETTVDGTGTYLFRNVPNGTFAVRFTKVGYAPQTSAGQLFDHTLGAVPDVSATLAPYQHLVNVQVNTSTSSANLTGATLKLEPVAVDGNLNGVKDTTVTGKTGTFGLVRFGCWKVTLGLPADHFGTLGYKGASNTVTGCKDPQHVVVPTTAPSGPITVQIDVSETEFRVRFVSATPVAGHTAPGSVTFGVTGPGGALTIANPTLTTGSTRTLWVPPGGSYTATGTPVNTPTTTFSPTFWPAATTGSLNVTTSNGPVAANLTLTELMGKFKVKVNGVTGARPATISVTGTGGQTGTVPTGYSSIAVTNDNIRTLDLPSGSWLITATFTAGGTADSKTIEVVSTTNPADSTAAQLNPTYPPPPPDPDPAPAGP